MIQIQLRPEVEARLAAEAEARGLSPERYIEQLIVERIPEPQAQAGPVSKLASLEEFFEAMAAHSEKIPQLPDEAFTRESFYQDHD
jgi:hypothetical protein